MGQRKQSYEDVLRAQKAAVALLRKMSAELPLRSDTKQRRAEIERIAMVLEEPEEADLNKPNDA